MVPIKAVKVEVKVEVEVEVKVKVIGDHTEMRSFMLTGFVKLVYRI